MVRAGSRRFAALLVAAPMAALVALATAGCSGTTAPPDPKSQPAGTPSPAVTPGADDRGSRVIDGRGFRIAAAGGFQQLDRLSSNGEPMLVLRRPSSVPEVPAVVAVLREPKPAVDVDTASYALEVAKRTAEGATAVSRTPVTWPGVQRAVLVQWTIAQPLDVDRRVPVRYWQLNVQTGHALRMQVVGISPLAEVQSSGMAATFDSYRVD